MSIMKVLLQKIKIKKDKKELTVFKYTLDGHIYESVIINDLSFFITFDKNELIIDDKIEQETRVLRPSHIEEYPSNPYEFESKEELEEFVNMIK
jgi:hypothetical protein